MERSNNGINQEIQMMLSIPLNAKQKFMYEWLNKNYEEIKISKLSELPNDLSSIIKNLVKRLDLQMKECYCNVCKFMSNPFNFKNYQVHYIEGRITCFGIPIDHAWLKFISEDGKEYYFDPTIELVLNRDVNEGTYVKFLDWDRNKTVETLLNKQVYGAWMYDEIAKEYEQSH